MTTMRPRIFDTGKLAAIAGVILACALTGCSHTPAEESATAGGNWAASAGLPAVTGGFGETPKIAKGEGEPPQELKTRRY